MPYAYPDGMSRSAHTAGRSSLRTPSRSIRCPPVSLIIGMAYFSATSAIRRSCHEVGDAALHLRHHREGAVALDVGVHPVVDEPSVPLVDELVGPHRLQQRRQRHLRVGVLLPSGASAANTEDTECNSSSRMWRINVGLSYGMPGTYHDADGSSVTAPPAAHSTIWPTNSLHEPQPLPALVFAITPATDVSPSCTQATSARLVHAVAVAHLSVVGQFGDPDRHVGVPMSNISDTRSSGSGSPLSNACVRNDTLLTSPTQRGADQLPVADDDGLVHAVLGFGVLHELVVGKLGRLQTHRRRRRRRRP